MDLGPDEGGSWSDCVEKLGNVQVRLIRCEDILDGEESPSPFYFVATIHLSRWAALERSWGQKSSRAKAKADNRVRELAMWKVR